MADEKVERPNSTKTTTRRPTVAVRTRIKRGAAIVATGATMTEASRRLGLRPNALSESRQLHPELWEQEYQRASEGVVREAKAERASLATRELITRAVALVVSGRSMREAAGLLGVKAGALYDCKRRYRDVWDAACGRESQASLSRTKAARPSEETVELIGRATAITAAGKTVAEAAEVLGLSSADVLYNCRRRYPDAWEKAWRRARKGGAKQARADHPSEAVCQLTRRAVGMSVSGKSLREVARVLGVKADALYTCKRRHRSLWETERQTAERQYAALGGEIKREVPKEVQEGIRKATALIAAGQKSAEIAQALGVKPGTIDWWKQGYRKLWEEDSERAMETALIVVRRQAGTDAVLNDLDTYLARALACERWARRKGVPLFPKPDDVTVSTFFAEYYKPNRLTDGSPETVKRYGDTLRWWMVLTGDPPLNEIDTVVMARFRDCLSRMRGKQPWQRMSVNTIRLHLRQLQTLLDKAGPPGPRNRDAAGLIERVPWVKPPREEVKLPRIATDEQLGAMYLAAIAMDVPRVPGIKPATWWRALLAVARNTGLRRRTLFELRFDMVDWRGARVDIPPRHMKSGRAESVHLNPTALYHLRTIRSDRELVFLWPLSRAVFDRSLHRLQDAAGIPRKQHIGLHNVRKAVATILWGESPAAAQLALGHASFGVTQKHYVAGADIVAKALDELSQPEAFASAES